MASPPSWKSRLLRLILPGSVALAAAVVAFFWTDFWWTHAAWKICQARLTARGESLDWNTFVPPTVADESNAFKAPMMKEWFGSELKPTPDASIDSPITTDLVKPAEILNVARITVLPLAARANFNPADADIVLRFISPGLAFFPVTNFSPATADEVRVSLDGIPLSSAVNALAKQSGLANIQFDASVKTNAPVNVGWENIEVSDALDALLNINGLRLINSHRVEAKSGGAASIFLPEPEGAALKVLRGLTLGSNAISPMGELILQRPLHDTRPLRIVLFSDTLPSFEDMESFCRDYVGDFGRYLYGDFEVNVAGRNSFGVDMTGVCTAADYLRWSDSFETNFLVIHKALQRPFAQLDNSQEVTRRVSNLVIMRQVAQTVAAQAECHLLLNQPAAALARLTLLHELMRLQDAKPASVVEKMIKAGVAGIHGTIIQEGLQSHTWKEPELAALEEQLRGINLPSDLASAFRAERAAAVYSLNPIFGNLTNNQYARDLVRGAMNGQIGIDALDLTPGLVSPARTAAYKQAAQKATNNWWVSVQFPNYSQAILITARNQTLVLEDRIACALERARLATGEYPATLEALTPRFIDRLPRDLIGGDNFRYRRTGSETFLLYSIGWNEKDDAGSDLDWVWGSRF